MKKLYSLWLVTMMLMLGACAQLGLKSPETFNQKVAVAYGTIVQVRESATMLLMQQQISVADAQQVQRTADIAREGVETARQLYMSNPNAADQKLNAIRATLEALSAYLATKQK